MDTITHPRYTWVASDPWDYDDFRPRVLIGDEVGLAGVTEPHGPVTATEILGTVTDIHGETFGDGPGDTITVIPAAVTLSSGDRYPVTDLVLLRRAEQ